MVGKLGWPGFLTSCPATAPRCPVSTASRLEDVLDVPSSNASARFPARLLYAHDLPPPAAEPGEKTGLAVCQGSPRLEASVRCQRKRSVISSINAFSVPRRIISRASARQT